MIHTITSSNENVTSPHVVGAVHDPPRLSAPSSYALVPAGPEVPAAEVELPNVDAIEVLVLWGTNVLHVAHRAITQGFFVGDASGAEPCDFVLPPDVLGTPRLPLVLGSGAGPDGVEAPARLVLPPGATGSLERPDAPSLDLSAALAQGRAADLYGGCVEVPLPAGARARVELGGLVFQIATVKAGRPTKKSIGAVLDFDVAAYFGLSLLSLGGLITALAYFAPPLSLDDDETISKERFLLLQQYLSAAAERQQEDRPQEVAPAESATPEGGTGTQAVGESGALGKATAPAANRSYALRGPEDETDLRLARAAAREEARSFGMIGMLQSSAGDPAAPTAPWGGDTALGNADLSAQGNMWGDDIGDAFGSGGLGLTGNGDGGGGRGAGIGLGDIGTLGHGRGLGPGQGFGPYGFGQSVGRRAAHTHVASAPRIRPSNTTVSGRLPPEVIQRVVRQNFGRFRMCYERGLTRNPNLEGRVAVRFVIGRDGAVSNAGNGGSDLADTTVTSCVLSAFYGLSFPPPDGGVVTVTYPLLFTPG
ncbi:MAG: AgmX/PglI C-terminal domain-containing protein [Myxococcales bacterium]|nr:AgmX/PglI C-terminal domain-containing protein [Myxococcales bacterium]